MKLVRNGQKVWPYCPECGCRLAITYEDNDWPMVDHFGWGNKDERGHECSLIGKGWITSPESVAHILVPQEAS